MALDSVLRWVALYAVLLVLAGTPVVALRRSLRDPQDARGVTLLASLGAPVGYLVGLATVPYPAVLAAAGVAVVATALATRLGAPFARRVGAGTLVALAGLLLAASAGLLGGGRWLDAAVVSDWQWLRDGATWLVAYGATAALAGWPLVALRRRLDGRERRVATAGVLAAGAGVYLLSVVFVGYPALLAGLAVAGTSLAFATVRDLDFDDGGAADGALLVLAVAALAFALGVPGLGRWPDWKVVHLFLRMETAYVGLWLVTFVALAAAALPLSALVLQRLPDRGAGVAFPVSLSVLWLVGYWLGQVTFGRVTAVVAVGALVALSAAAATRDVDVDWRAFGEVVGVFVVAFGLLLALRSVNPQIWASGGEKFLDFGLLKSLLRTEALPPEDMWFAGEPVKYYYGGHMLAALLTELTGTPARYAYNLALAGFYGALAASAYGVARCIAAGQGYPKRAAGVLGAFLVAGASNLSTPLRALVWLLPGGAGDWVATVADLEVGARPSIAAGPEAFNYWYASRSIDFWVINGNQWYLITEFPFFAFRNGDLHAHMLSTPFMLLTVAVLYAYWRTPADERTRRRLLVFGCVPLLAGLLAVTNTWSFPTVGGLTALTLALAPTSPWGLLPGPLREFADRLTRDRAVAEGVRPVSGAVGAVAVLALGALVVVPFFLGTASGRDIGAMPEPRSGVTGLLTVHGAFLLVGAIHLTRRLSLRRPVAGVGLAALAVLFGVTYQVNATAVALFVPVVLVGWYLLRTDAGAGFETLLLMGGAGLVVILELAYVVEEAGPGRMNTVFKTYMQVWVLFGVACGPMLAEQAGFGRALAVLRGAARDAAGVLRRAAAGDRGLQDPAGDRPPAEASAGAGPGPATDRTRSDGGLPGARALLSASLALLLVLSLSLYGGLVLQSQLGNGVGDPTLNGTAYVPDRHPAEAKAIAWLDDREGQPTIVEAPGTAIYRWANPASSLTGLPTVAGWNHEVGYRGRDAYQQRVAHVDQIFEGSAERRAQLLRYYDVEYVYYGPAERERYGEGLLAADPGISVAVEYGFVTVYEVDRSALVGNASGG